MTEFRRLTEDVYAFLQPPLIWYSSAGVIIDDRDVIVVDSLTNAEGFWRKSGQEGLGPTQDFFATPLS